MARVGWATSKEPLLSFKNLIAKPRKERSKKDTIETPQTPQLQVGNDIVNIETVRFQLKTQFDRNIVTHFEAQEHLFDYAFQHLGIDTENCVEHPIVLTEAFLNPNTSRQCKFAFLQIFFIHVLMMIWGFYLNRLLFIFSRNTIFILKKK